MSEKKEVEEVRESVEDAALMVELTEFILMVIPLTETIGVLDCLTTI